MPHRSLGILPRHLRWRLVLPVSLVVFAVLVGYGADAARRQSELFESLIVGHGQGLAGSIAVACSNAVLEQDVEALEGMLLNEMRHEQALSLQVLDATGHLLADVDRLDGPPTVRRGRPAPAVPAMAGEWMEHANLPGRNHVPWHWHPVKGDLVVWTTIPSPAGTPPLGWVRATLDMSVAHDAQHDIWAGHVIGILVAVLLSLSGVALLSRGPIAALLRAREFALSLDHERGRQMPGYPQVEEIDQLFSALNAASRNLARQDEELLAGQRFLSGITETLGEGVYATDRDSRCTFMNREAERLTGWSRAEMLGQPICGWLDFNDPAYDANTHPCTCTRAMLSKEARRDDDIFYTRKDGSRFPVSVKSTPLIEKGEVQGAVVVFRDVSLRKQAEQAMLAARQAAEASSRAKSEFLANMSHEIRTPLNAIIGMVHLALNTELSPHQRDYLRQIDDSSRHLLGLVSNVLDYAKIEAGKVTVEPVPFHLDALLEAAAALHADMAAGKPVALTCTVERDVPRRLIGDFKKLKQILLNYVGNAIKFTERGGIGIVVRVEARDADGVLLHFAVHDTGIGMTEAEIDLLFQSFQQADSSTTRKYSGSGLGLAIAKRLAGLLGGEVGVTSEYGRGSTFWFTARVKPDLLTRADTGQAGDDAARAATEAERLAAIAGARILLVEDNLVNQEIARHFVQAAGCTVDIADNGQIALTMLKARPPDTYDLVLMDVMMPVMDGLDACMALRRLPALAALPVVAMTANASESERARCLEAGMNDFLSKPFTPKDLWPILFHWIPPGQAAPSPVAGSDAPTADSTAGAP